jgi:hypothetical protein
MQSFDSIRPFAFRPAFGSERALREGAQRRKRDVDRPYDPRSAPAGAC